MPIYEFHCDKCGQDSEVLVRSSDWKGTPCPACGSTRLAKKFSTFAASVQGRLHAGEEMQDAEAFLKADLLFPSGEPLPRCWLDSAYKR